MGVFAALLLGWLLASTVQGDMEASALYDPGNAYCRRDSWVGNLRVTKPVGTVANGEIGVVYDHRSCLTEEADRYTSDVMGFTWRRRF